jgi:hypothetical protein
VPAPPTAEHPIYFPIVPDNSLPDVPGTEPPLVIWGPDDPRPSPPIYIPIQPPPVEGGGGSPQPPIYIPVYPASHHAGVSHAANLFRGSLPRRSGYAPPEGTAMPDSAAQAVTLKLAGARHSWRGLVITLWQRAPAGPFHADIPSPTGRGRSSLIGLLVGCSCCAWSSTSSSSSSGLSHTATHQDGHNW